MKKNKINLVKFLIIFLGLIFFFVFLSEFSFKYLGETLFFALCIGIAEYYNVLLSQGGSISVAAAPIMAAIFILPLPNAVAATFFGFLGMAIYKGIRFKSVKNELVSLAQGVIIVCLTGLVFRFFGGSEETINLVSTIRRLEIPPKEVLLAFIPILSSFVFYFLVDISFSQLLFSFEKGTPFIYAWLGAVGLLGQIYIAFFASSLLISLLFHSVSYWSIFLFVLPLFVVRYSFKLYMGIKETYWDTIKALAKAVEVQDKKRMGHAERVADYAISIAREMGVYGDDLETLGLASYLHDIGKVGIEEDTLDSALDLSGVLQGEPLHAKIGAEILEQVEYLKHASDIVLKHHALFGQDKEKSADIPLAARIIGVATYFDELVNIEKPESRLNPTQALAKVKKEQSFRFDPKVVRALTRSLKRRGYAVTV